MNMYVEWSYAPQFLTLALDGSEWSVLLLRIFPLVPFRKEIGWAPEPVWTLWSLEKSLAPARDRILVIQPVTVLNELFWIYTFIHGSTTMPSHLLLPD
jgi:hypothetical protein